MRLIDLSPPIDATSVHWPGDHGFSRVSRWQISSGDSVNVSTVTTTTQLGAHIDAPAHVLDGAPAIDQTPLEATIGPCVVLDVSGLVVRTASPHTPAPAAAVRHRLQHTVADLAVADLPVERLLLRHHQVAHRSWYADSPGLDPDLVAWFGAQGGRLIGVDLDSFDPTACRTLPAHRAAIDAGIVIMEGLDLAAAPEGPAELLAAPIPWRGADGAPVRAVLRIF